MVMLGGAANDLGVVAGTFIFVAVRQTIVFYSSVFAPFLPFDVVWLDTLLLGLALIFILIYRPQGLIPEKPIKTINTGIKGLDSENTEDPLLNSSQHDSLLERLWKRIVLKIEQWQKTA
jgi:hypothetical protein